ncbi:MAG: PorV/PorQ family protein [bacterium]|nr:PorV/PorQ family protein [bacterium]
MKKVFFSLLAAGMAVLPIQTAWATPESRAAANFLLFEPSARASGMGNAYVAIADDANATYYNPAALADYDVRSLSTTFYKPVPNLASDIFSSFGAYTQPVQGIGNLGFSLNYTSLGEQVRTDAQGNNLGTFTSFGFALGVSYGTHLFRNMSLGVTVKFIHENLSGAGAGIEQGKGAGTSFAGDMGFMWKTTDRLTLAWVLRNVGPNMTFIDADQADPLPQNFTLGIAYTALKRDNYQVLLTTDIYKPLADQGFFSFITGWNDSEPDEEFKDIDYHVGAEWQYYLSEDSAFALRAGYSYDQDGNRKPLTFGMGLKYNWASFDLSYFADSNAALRNVFRFSGGFAF